MQLAAAEQADSLAAVGSADLGSPWLLHRGSDSNGTTASSRPRPAAAESTLTTREYLLVVGALVLVQLNWSILTTWVKSVLTRTPAIVFCSYRDGVAVICLMLAAWWREDFARPLLRRAGWALHGGFVLVCGVLMFLNQLANVLGIVFSSPTTSSMTQPLIPAWVFSLSILCALDQSEVLRAFLARRKHAAASLLAQAAGPELARMSFSSRASLWCQARLPVLRLLGGLGVLVSALGAGIMVLGELSNKNSSQKNPLVGLLLFAANTLAMSLSIIVQKMAFKQRTPSAPVLSSTQQQQQQQQSRKTLAAASFSGRAHIPSVTDVASETQPADYSPPPALYSPSSSSGLSASQSPSPPPSPDRPEEVRLRLLPSSSATDSHSNGSVGSVFGAVSTSEDDDASDLSSTSLVPLSEWQRYPISLTAYGYLVCFLCMFCSSGYYIPAALRSGDWTHDFIPRAPAVPALLFGGVCASAVNFALLTWATSRVPPPLVTAFWPLQIPAVALMCLVCYGDRLGATEATGSAVLCLGMGALVAVQLKTFALEKEAREASSTVEAREQEELAQQQQQQQPAALAFGTALND